MKVAIITSYCLDSTMPLAKHLGDNKINISLYSIVPQYNQNAFVIDFSTDKQPNGFIKKDILNRKMGVGLCNYLSNITTKMFVYPAGAGKRAYLNDIYQAWILSRDIIKNNFDVVHLIHTANRFSLLLLYFLRKKTIIQTLHEVTAHNGDNNTFDDAILKQLIKKDIPIIFNSNISKQRFLSYRASCTKKPINESLYTMIRFSLYETYLHFLPLQKRVSTKISDKDVPVILHFGRIVPYKGIEILIDAIKILQRKQKVHLIVAGGGDAYFNFDGIDSYEFLNYSISNEQIVDLIKNCTVVVCPYRSASQSGIPMTVFPFNKPIIASNIGGFKEIIEDGFTGLVVDKIDAASFAKAISAIITNDDLIKAMAINIDKKFKEGDFSWINIARQTTNFYSNHLVNASNNN